MDSHFSNSPLVFGSGLTCPTVVTGGATERKKTKTSGIKSHLHLTFLLLQVEEVLRAVSNAFAFTLRLRRRGC